MTADTAAQPASTDTRNWFARHKALTVVLVIVVLVILGNLLPKALAAPVEPAMIVSAADLLAAYDANEIQADTTYKGKRLEIAGKLKNVETMLGSSFVTVGPDNPILSVQCMLAESELSKAGQVQKGADIVVVGKSGGKSANVVIDDRIIK